MKVTLVKEKKPKRRRKPPKQTYKAYSVALEKVPLGHIYTLPVYSFMNCGYDIKQYLSRIYNREFVLIHESKNLYIIKRVAYAKKTHSEKTEIRKGRFYFPKRKTGNRKMGGHGNSGREGSPENSGGNP